MQVRTRNFTFAFCPLSKFASYCMAPEEDERCLLLSKRGIILDLHHLLPVSIQSLPLYVDSGFISATALCCTPISENVCILTLHAYDRRCFFSHKSMASSQCNFGLLSFKSPAADIFKIERGIAHRFRCPQTAISRRTCRVPESVATHIDRIFPEGLDILNI